MLSTGRPEKRIHSESEFNLSFSDEDLSLSDLDDGTLEEAILDARFQKEDPSSKDLMDILHIMKNEGSGRGKKLDRVDKKLTKFGKAIKNLRASVKRQDEIITGLEKRLNDQAVKLIHMNNNWLQERNINRLSSLIFTGTACSSKSLEPEVRAEISKIMGVLGISTFELLKYVVIPWGKSHAVKCTFSSVATTGLVLRNSFKLASNKVNCGVRPDLSPEQRDIRKKLNLFGKELEKKSNAQFSVRSWRYLAVTYPNGSSAFFEADISSEPMEIEPTAIRAKITAPKKQFIRQSNSEFASQTSNVASQFSSVSQPPPNQGNNPLAHQDRQALNSGFGFKDTPRLSQTSATGGLGLFGSVNTGGNSLPAGSFRAAMAKKQQQGFTSSPVTAQPVDPRLLSSTTTTAINDE